MGVGGRSPGRQTPPPMKADPPTGMHSCIDNFNFGLQYIKKKKNYVCISMASNDLAGALFRISCF